MNQGRIVQTGTPLEVFSNPTNAFVAHFAGIRNFFKARIVQHNGKNIAMVENDVAIVISDSSQNNSGYILIRNEDILISPEPLESSALNNFQGTVLDIFPSRSGMEVLIDIGITLHAQISSESAAKFKLIAGRKFWLTFKASSVKLITG